MRNIIELESILREHENIIGYDYLKDNNIFRLFVNTKEAETELKEELKDFKNIDIIRGLKPNGRR